MKDKYGDLEATITLLLVAVALGLTVAALVLTSCTDGDDCGKAGATRCYENTAEVCSASGTWLPDDDCNEVHMLDGSTERWTCCDANGVAVCMEVCK